MHDLAYWRKNGRFKNSWSRADRATKHVSAFKAEWDRLFKDNPLGSIARYDKGSGWYIASCDPNPIAREAFRNTTLPLIVGEFAYQLRAALDGLIWDAITFKQSGAEPPADANSLYFPILNGKDRDFQKCGFHKFPFPDNLKVWLESIQPDSAEKPVGHPDRGLANALKDVHNLARLDRHRRLRVIASLPTELYANFVFDPPDGFKVISEEGLPCDVLGGEYELLRFKVDSVTGERPKKVRVETASKFEVFFEDLSTYEGVPPGERLINLEIAVEYVISRFEEEFAV